MPQQQSGMNISLHALANCVIFHIRSAHTSEDLQDMMRKVKAATTAEAAAAAAATTLGKGRDKAR